MKYFSVILALVLLVPILRPCKWNDSHHAVAMVAEEGCHSTAEKHSCCQLPVQSKEEPQEEDACADGCSCFCCSLVIAETITAVREAALPQEGQETPWQVSMYDHQFSYQIWQPPRLS